MTDLERFVTFLKSVGVDVTSEKGDGWSGTEGSSITLSEETPGLTWGGYSGFFAYFSFDNEGRFIGAGAGE